MAINKPELSASGLVTDHKPTNNVAELTAVLKALEIAKKYKMNRIVIATDSKYAKSTLDNVYKHQANNWKNSKNKRISNDELVKLLPPLIDGLSIKCIYVKGHSDDQYNIKVDSMAKSLLPLKNHITIASIDTIKWNEEPDIREWIQNLAEAPHEDYLVLDNQLYYVDQDRPVPFRLRKVVPESQRKLMLRLAHDDPICGSHLGIKKTRNKLLEYYWPKQASDVVHFVANCDKCQRNKRSHGKKMGFMQIIPVSKLFERIHLDIVGPVTPTPSGNLYVIT